MVIKKNLTPDFIFELSWEVCNKVGGIHTVLASLAPSMKKHFGENVVYIGPDLHTNEFVEDKQLKKDWAEVLKKSGLRVRIGRWNIASNPIAIVVDTNQCLDVKNEVYGEMWNAYKVDSLHAYGDYDEASMWAYASGRVVETIVSGCFDAKSKVVLQAHEWLSALGLLHIKNVSKTISTVFTTHATSIGRSICGNGKSLYRYLNQYDGDTMSYELNMQSKHSSEKAAALFADCFTTVSSITDRECQSLLGKKCDVVLPNGFETSLVPDAKTYKSQRDKGRRKILNVIKALTGKELPSNTLIISTSGRNDYRPKGFDVYMESLKRLNESSELTNEIVALIEVPCWMESPREDLLLRLKSKESIEDKPLENPFITHNLHNLDYDRIVSTIRSLGLDLATINGKVHVLLIPTYLNGADGVFDVRYYELLTACDFTVYPSYYEPWGYTPMESAAFRIPTITTDLAGFGCWVNELHAKNEKVGDGVIVLHRDDENYFEIAENIKDVILKFNKLSVQKRQLLRRSAAKIVKNAEWEKFIENYIKAFAFALDKRGKSEA